MAAHGLIHTRIDAIQSSNACAKLSALTKTASTTEATSPATRVTFQRAARTPIKSAASEHARRDRRPKRRTRHRPARRRHRRPAPSDPCVKPRPDPRLRAPQCTARSSAPRPTQHMAGYWRNRPRSSWRQRVGSHEISTQRTKSGASDRQWHHYADNSRSSSTARCCCARPCDMNHPGLTSCSHPTISTTPATPARFARQWC